MTITKRIERLNWSEPTMTTPFKPIDYLTQISSESSMAHQVFLYEHGGDVLLASGLMADSIKDGGKMIIMGNGGSAADAQHMAAEMVGALLDRDRRPLPAIALTTDTSILTAISNDFGYNLIFSMQIEALAKSCDTVIALSTSGNSENVIQGIQAAKKIGCKVIALTGGDGGEIKKISDMCLNVSEGKNSCRIQETHIFVVHALVDLLERFYLV